MYTVPQWLFKTVLSFKSKIFFVPLSGFISCRLPPWCHSTVERKRKALVNCNAITSEEQELVSIQKSAFDM